MKIGVKSQIGKEDIKWWDGVNSSFVRKTTSGGKITLTPIGGMVDVAEVYGDGSPSQGAIVNAINSIGTRQATLYLCPGVWSITSNLTIPSNIQICPINGAIFAVSSGASLAIGGNEAIYPEWFGAKGDGTTDDTAAFQSCVSTALMAGCHILARGTYLLTSTIAFTKTHNYMTVLDGGGTGIFDFEPTAEDVMFDVTNGASVFWCFHLKDFRVFSNDTTYKKTAIQAADFSTSKIENVIIGASDKWTGNGSVGLRTLGRELTVFENLRIHADIPIQISKNSNSTVYQTDGFHFSDLFLYALDDTKPNILVDDGVNISNLTIDGYQHWTGGLNGFYYNNTENTGNTSSAINIKNVRWEQTAPACTGYMVTVTDNSTNPLISSVILENCIVVGDTDTPAAFSAGGVKLRKVGGATLINCASNCDEVTSKVASFDTCTNIKLINFSTPSGVSPTLTSMVTVAESRSWNDFAIVEAYYDYLQPE